MRQGRIEEALITDHRDVPRLGYAQTSGKIYEYKIEGTTMSVALLTILWHFCRPTDFKRNKQDRRFSRFVAGDSP